MYRSDNKSLRKRVTHNEALRNTDAALGSDAQSSSSSSPKAASEPKFFSVPTGTSVYHGTQRREGEKEWWLGENPYPNKEGEDGGVSFTLNPNASPKTRKATVLLEYTVEWNIQAFHCERKGDFYDIFRENPEAICYTLAEEELVIPVNAVSTWLSRPKEMKLQGPVLPNVC